MTEIREACYRQVPRKLFELGLMPEAKVNLILAEAVYQYRKAPGLLHGCWCKQMLPAIGYGTGVSPASVEGHIRRTIAYLWDMDASRTKQLLNLRPDAQMPTVRSFVVLLSGVIA